MNADTTRRYAVWRGVRARSLRGRLDRRVLSATSREQGQIGVLALGLFVLAAILVLGAIDVTAAQLARMRLLDAADSAALDAADALDERAAYEGGSSTTWPSRTSRWQGPPVRTWLARRCRRESRRGPSSPTPARRTARPPSSPSAARRPCR